jgi:tRNA(Ile)-lysidine synthase
LTRSLPDAVAAFAPQLPLAVAFSGGADSTALLLACARRWPGQVVAVHVHHRLQAAADSFEQHCVALCQSIDVPLIVRRVDARNAPGDSPEDAARTARYQALDAAVRGEEGTIRFPSVALAQHADDQVETLLLALSRGAGLPGLAAMPACRMRNDVAFHRPLLEVSAASIRDWLQAQGVRHVEDPTNADEGLTRIRFRARLLPALAQAFPQFRDTFARSARHAAQAQQLLDAIAAEDLARVGSGAGLSIAALQALDSARQANLLRHWLRQVHSTAASAAQMRELQGQIRACTTRGHRICIKVGDGFVECQRAHLSWYNGRPVPTLTG